MILPPLIDPKERSEEQRELDYAMSQCVRCASCFPTCPTYQETQNEGHSPRGRVSLLRDVHEGGADASKVLSEYIYGCLECRACETACPNGVKFHKVVEYGKETLNDAGIVSTTGRFFKWLFLGKVFSNGRNLDRFMGFLRFYRRSGLRAVTRVTRFLRLLPWHLYDLEKLMPRKTGAHRPVKRKSGYLLKPAGEICGTVDFFHGCIADHWLQEANHATLRMLLRAGYAVNIPGGQECCGALHVHLGEADGGRGLATRNMTAFSGSSNPVAVNAAGCGAMLKEYGELFHRTETEKEAETFSGRVTDFTDLLVARIDHLPAMRALDATITYDDPCHLIHGQGISAGPRILMNRIPGATFVELTEASWCCGSAGVYNITNYGMSMQLLKRKMNHVAGTGADILVTANPGCYLQLSYGAKAFGMNIEVVHLAELLDRCYDAAPELAPDSDAPPWEQKA